MLVIFYFDRNVYTQKLSRTSKTVSMSKIYELLSEKNIAQGEMFQYEQSEILVLLFQLFNFKLSEAEQIFKRIFTGKYINKRTSVEDINFSVRLYFQLLVGGFSSGLIYVICVCWPIVVSNTYCVVCLFVFSSCFQLLRIVLFIFGLRLL